MGGTERIFPSMGFILQLLVRHVGPHLTEIRNGIHGIGAGRKERFESEATGEERERPDPNHGGLVSDCVGEGLDVAGDVVHSVAGLLLLEADRLVNEVVTSTDSPNLQSHASPSTSALVAETRNRPGRSSAGRRRRVEPESGGVRSVD